MRFPFVIFDLNGTLVDTFADLTTALNETLTELQRPLLDESQVRPWTGQGLRAMLRAALVTTGAPLTDLEIAGLLQGFRTRYAERLGAQAHLYPEVPETLREMQQAGVRMAILTNKPQEQSLALLERMGIAQYFEYFLSCTGGDAPGPGVPRKPDPAGVHQLIAQMGGTEELTLMVGSSRIDRETARNAGLTCAIVQQPQSEASRLYVHGLGADFVLDEFRKLRALVLGRRESGAFPLQERR